MQFPPKSDKGYSMSTSNVDRGGGGGGGANIVLPPPIISTKFLKNLNMYFNNTVNSA